MDIAPIKSHCDFRRVLREVEGLMNARRNSPEGDRLDALVTLVEAWERKHCDCMRDSAFPPSR